MVKQILPAIAIIVLLGSCSSLKSLNFTSGRQVAAGPVSNSSPSTTELKFIDKISIIPQPIVSSTEVRIDKTEVKIDKKETVGAKGYSIDEATVKEEEKSVAELMTDRSLGLENSSDLQLKYALLLNTDVVALQNKALLEVVYEWYGTRYRMGGTSKKGVDCSAFVCAIYSAVFCVALPRTARDQYRYTRHISRTQLQEGDLLFFNTRGGVSHVGIYLQNNKFIHASVARGVTVSDMFETYYLKHFIGAGRVENKQGPLASN